MDWGQNVAKLALSKGGSGPKLGKASTIVHYPKVELGQILAKLALSEGESGPKSGKAGTIVHVDTIQGWTWAQSGQSL